ncbi:hypothetical protein HYC85_023961 [Camellia sinensis]|uniref:TIR domain-containing protein n=1 Tax=Camellia sinensis TaxID=4442 RepID=A0A7J7GG03_CAMSI|nr:hypothetical protein HYC85_023961 [Camellia sinensis]
MAGTRTLTLPRWSYDVFLSFSGEDTRKNFTDHLYEALVQAGIHTFRDDDELPRGREISSELLKSIEESRISIVVFSRNYASSRWCLDELVKIIECKKTLGQLVLPIFYHVDPSEVRHQKGCFGEAFGRYAKRYVDEMEKVKVRRAALSEAADLLGWVANGSDAKLIRRFVKQVSCKLKRTSLNVAKHPVGIETRVEHINSLLSIGSDDVRMIGIYGLGGIGKTTIAKAVYNHIFRRFDGSCFLANVREFVGQFNGLVKLQNQLLFELLQNKKLNIGSVDRGMHLIKANLYSRRVLIVLDDLDQLVQLNSLAGNRDWFGPGSRIIITTRNEHLLMGLKVDERYMAEELNREESLQLFNWHAFGDFNPLENYADLANGIVSYASGLPLALEVLGSYLFGRNMVEWKSALNKLQQIPQEKIQEKLRISFDALDDDNIKDSFLDIAWQPALGELSSSSFSCPMEGRSREVMVVVLKFVWESKSIITRHCIKHLCTSVCKDTKLNKMSLLSCWIKKDLIETQKAGKHVLKDLIKSFLLEEVSNDYVRMKEETREVLLKQFIPHLRPLYLKQEGMGLSEAPEVAEWDAKEIYLNNNHLSELPEKPNCPSLVTLFLQENYDLMEIPSSFFECMPMLQVLDLSHTSIKSLPASISGLVSLQELFLRGCELLMELSPEIGALSKLQVLDLEGTELMYLPKEISGLTKLECLKVSLYGYGKSYREGKHKRIPAGLLANLCMLKALSIDVNPDDDEWVADVKDVMDELLKLKGLMTLKLYLPEVGLLKEITSVRNFKFTVGHHKRGIISCLPHEAEEEFKKQENYLKYINGKYIPIEIQNALKCTCAFFLERHWAVKKLSEFGNENMVELKFCLLVECNELQTIIDGGEFCTEGDQICESGVDKTPVFQSLEYLGIHCMMNLRSIWEGPIGKGCLSKLKYMALHSCPNLTGIFTTSLLGNLDNLEELIIEDCPQISSLVSQESSCFEPNPYLPSLKKISLLDLPELVSISSGHLFAPKLERIIIYACPMLESLSPMELSSNYLKVIKGEIEWWNSLKWLESEWTSRQKDCIANVFVELKRDASLMDQLAESENSM